MMDEPFSLVNRLSLRRKTVDLIYPCFLPFLMVESLFRVATAFNCSISFCSLIYHQAPESFASLDVAPI